MWNWKEGVFTGNSSHNGQGGNDQLIQEHRQCCIWFPFLSLDVTVIVILIKKIMKKYNKTTKQAICN